MMISMPRTIIKYHLAYVGGLESIFTPSFRLMLDNREPLFSGAEMRGSRRCSCGISAKKSNTAALA